MRLEKGDRYNIQSIIGGNMIPKEWFKTWNSVAPEDVSIVENKICLMQKDSGTKWICISNTVLPNDSQDHLLGYLLRRINDREFDFVLDNCGKDYVAVMQHYGHGGQFPCEALLFAYVQKLVSLVNPGYSINVDGQILNLNYSSKAVNADGQAIAPHPEYAHFSTATDGVAEGEA
jgi:hypothetical protein